MRAFHALGGMAASGAVSSVSAGMRVRISSKVWRQWHLSRLSRSPSPPHPASELLQGGERPPGEGDGGQGRGGLRSWSGSGGGWGCGTRIGGAENGKHGAVRGGREMGTCDDSGARGGARGSGSSGSNALGSCGGASGSESGARGAWGRVRRGGIVGSRKAVGGSVLRAGSGSVGV